MTIEEILAEMRQWAAPGDPEISHDNGDRLLMELARTLAKGRKCEASVAEILRLFAAMDKWYS